MQIKGITAAVSSGRTNM